MRLTAERAEIVTYTVEYQLAREATYRFRSKRSTTSSAGCLTTLTEPRLSTSQLLLLTSSKRSRSEESGAASTATPPLAHARPGADQTPEKSLQTDLRTRPHSTNKPRETPRRGRLRSWCGANRRRTPGSVPCCAVGREFRTGAGAAAGRSAEHAEERADWQPGADGKPPARAAPRPTGRSRPLAACRPCHGA
jgi:hypothetical protein